MHHHVVFHHDVFSAKSYVEPPRFQCPNRPINLVMTDHSLAKLTGSSGKPLLSSHLFAHGMAPKKGDKGKADKAEKAAKTVKTNIGKKVGCHGATVPPFQQSKNCGVQKCANQRKIKDNDPVQNCLDSLIEFVFLLDHFLFAGDARDGDR